jgi:hypothetical protein
LYWWEITQFNGLTYLHAFILATGLLTPVSLVGLKLNGILNHTIFGETEAIIIFHQQAITYPGLPM